MAFIDVITSFATLAELKNFVKPELLNECRLNITNGRHPVVEES